MKAKEKLATAVEIYNRICWDERLDKNAFAIGYIDRMRPEGFREKDLIDWQPEGDIPWHRIIYFKCAGERVWDRERRLDAFADDSLPAEAWAQEGVFAVALPVLWAQAPTYKYADGQWTEQPAPSIAPAPERLRVASWNLLCDQYLPEQIYTEARHAEILRQLEALDADIVALQEVTPAFWEKLCQCGWAKARYYLSESPRAESFAPQNIAVLSKHPFALEEGRFSPHKRVLQASFGWSDRPLHLAAVHLTSNRSQRAPQQRPRQLSTALSHLSYKDGARLVLGDFNDADTALAEPLAKQGYQDLWLKHQPQRDGISFDTRQNPLAALMSLSGIPSRLDYMYLREADQWRSESIQFFAHEAFAQTEDGRAQFASDHYGLVAEFRSAQAPQSAVLTMSETLKNTPPVYTSAIVWIPPQAAHPTIQRYRQQHDRHADRWMPHITLVYGFVPESHFAEALPHIAAAVRGIQPFQVSLDTIETFSHRKSATGFAAPSHAQDFQTLQRALESLFPLCNEQSSRSGTFHPHLTLGQFDSEALAKKTLADWKPLHTHCGEIALISREKDTPFEVKYLVQLGTGAVLSGADGWQLPAAQQLLAPTDPILTQRQSLLSLVKEVCSELLGMSAEVVTTGSARLGLHERDSDVDAFVLIPQGRVAAEFLGEVQALLQQLGVEAKLVANTQYPVLKICHESQWLDLQAANNPFFPKALHQLSQSDQHSFGQRSWQVLCAGWEADIILQQMRDIGAEALYRNLLNLVRTWAKSRAVYGQAFGYLGGFSWAVLCALTLKGLCSGKKQLPSLEQALRGFFQQWSNWNAAEIYGLTPNAQQAPIHPQALWTIRTSSAGSYDTARHLIPATARTLRQELQRARQLTQSQPPAEWGALFETPDYSQLEPMHLRVEATPRETLETRKESLASDLWQTLRGLEQSGRSVRIVPGWVQEPDGAWTVRVYGL